MKILIIGFLVLFSWSALSTHLYVCHIKGLCSEKENIAVKTTGVNNSYTADTLPKAPAAKPAEMHENLTVYFAFDKSEINSDPETATSLDKSLTYMKQNIQAGLSITGYTDAIGSDEYNQRLGFRRAQSVQHYFESKGVAAVKISIGSKGEKEPAADNGTSEGRAKNRRAIISIKN